MEGAWEDLALRLRGAMQGCSYGTGDYAIMSVARMVALDKCGFSGSDVVSDEWALDKRALLHPMLGDLP